MSLFSNTKIQPALLEPTLNSVLNTQDSEDSEELSVWEPSSDINETINSLEVFRTLQNPEDNTKLTRKEIRLSLNNFDDWLIDSIEHLIEEKKQKDIDMFN